MTGQLISFETAKLAKKKGLKRSLDRAGNLTGYNLKWSNPDKSPSYYHVHTQYPSEKEWLFAPTQSLFQKHLREEYNIILLIGKGESGYTWKIIGKIEGGFYKTYEKALEIGFVHAITPLKSL